MLKIKHVEYNKLDKKLYDDIICNAENTTPFHSLEWLEAIIFSYNNLKLLFVIIYENNIVVAVMPYFKKKNIPSTMISSIFSCYGGFVYKKEFHDKIKDFLITKKLYALITVVNNFDEEAKDFYRATGLFVEEKQETWILECKNSYEDIFLKLDTKTRNQVRKAFKSNIDIRPIESLTELEQCKSLYKDLIKKHNIKNPYPLMLFEELFNKSLANKEIMFYVAVLSEQVIAYSVFLKSAKQIFYWLNASDSGFSSLNATNGILAKILQYACQEKNVLMLNFGAVPTGNNGLLHFKKNWGAQHRIYYTYNSKFYYYAKKIILKLNNILGD